MIGGMKPRCVLVVIVEPAVGRDHYSPGAPDDQFHGKVSHALLTQTHSHSCHGILFSIEIFPFDMLYLPQYVGKKYI